MTLTAYEWAARQFEPRSRRYPSPMAMAQRLDSKINSSPALDLINRNLVDLADHRTAHDSLAVFIAPQEGKSTLVARRFPAWLLEDNPTLRIAIISYEFDTAVRWGRDIRRDIDQADGDLTIRLREDSRAAGRWETPQGGGVYCVGVGGPLTGRAVDVLLVDDPVKDRADAESARMRDRSWEWWESVALTRLAPGAIICLIQCMTGDTPVLMGDGTERPLREVRPGDIVATYEDGELSTSAVRNWANQGPDSVCIIRTKSGAAVKANARHPFLVVQDGVETWQRTDSLRPGSRILRVTGGNGGESPAPAVNPRDAQAATARDCACPATTGSDGLTVCDHRQSTRNPAGPPTSATATASAPQSMTGYSRSKAASALSASAPTASLPIGSGRSASITATTPGGYAGCSATTATLSSATPQQNQPCGPQPTTYAIEPDEVVEVVPCGVEDVFDLQIDRTENFIAGGLVSHNTRWHQDDLAGRILTRPSARRWETIRIPAIAEDNDPVGRQRGEELISARGREPGYFLGLRAAMSPYVFSGIYQQSPTAAEGNFFRRSTFRYWREIEPWPDGRRRLDLEGRIVTLADCWRFGTVDVAASTKTTADYTVVSMWAVAPEGDLILLDRARAQVAQHDHFGLAEPLFERYGQCQLFVERHFFATTLVTDAQAAGVPVAEVIADTDKVTRAIPAAARVHAGRAWFPAAAEWLDEWTDELASFPTGTHDDQVDTLAYAARVLTAEWTPPTTPPRRGVDPHERAVQLAAGSAIGSGEVDLMNVPY